ncbi:hypothetical protein ACEPAG_2366 [Sanghuangporus baumii]
MTAHSPPLPYDYNALEPYLSEQIMKLHHTKHHQTYVTALNAAEEQYAKASTPSERIALQDSIRLPFQFRDPDGDGWVLTRPQRSSRIVTTMNQDPLLTLLPIIGIDIWEHAFYLQYLNVKPDYLNAIWNVIDFDEAAKRFDAAVTQGVDAGKV